MNDHSIYQSPLSARYASKEMKYLFSEEKKFKTWRKLWIALAQAEQELGLSITDEQIAQLQEYAEDINYDVAKAREAVVRHEHRMGLSVGLNVLESKHPKGLIQL